ncbi:hypothetical protein [Levilactobacillus brevis]|uniref:hypothetical protein n=1 Tax=Levilactobacillus brevis TaxID=1580 RepID=UPI002073A7AE|nr:hypothetical protein [Levilactobacillus brevis]
MNITRKPAASMKGEELLTQYAYVNGVLERFMKSNSDDTFYNGLLQYWDSLKREILKRMSR